MPFTATILTLTPGPGIPLPPSTLHPCPRRRYYYQAEVQGQVVTWLVPHATSQVLPMDVDYKVMLTFLEFYSTLLQVRCGVVGSGQWAGCPLSGGRGRCSQQCCPLRFHVN